MAAVFTADRARTESTEQPLVAKPAKRARKSISEWNDREAGLAAAVVVLALAAVVVLIIAGVVLYATTWGYSVSLG